MDVPTPRTWLANEIQPYSVYQQELVATLRFLLDKPMCKVARTTAQAQASSAWTIMSWNLIESDRYGMANALTPTRITPTVPGWYSGWMGASYAPLSTAVDTTGIRVVALCKNSSIFSQFYFPAAKTANQGKNLKGLPFTVSVNGTTDYLEMYTWQTGGGSINTDTTAYPEMYLRWARRL